MTNRGNCSNFRGAARLGLVGAGEYAGHMNQRLVQGQRVLVSHLQGQEEGTIESVNYKTGKVLVFFNQKECPHYDSFNLSQVTPFPLRVIGETNTEITN